MRKKDNSWKCLLLPVFVFLLLIVLFFTKNVNYSIIFILAAMINLGAFFLLERMLKLVLERKKSKSFFLVVFFVKLFLIMSCFILFAARDIQAAFAFLAGLNLLPLSLMAYSIKDWLTGHGT